MVRNFFSRLKFDKTQIFIIRFKLNKGDREREAPASRCLSRAAGRMYGQNRWKICGSRPPEEHLLYKLKIESNLQLRVAVLL